MTEYFEIRRLLKFIQKWWWLQVIFVVIASIIGYLISTRLPPVYEATATFLVGKSTQSVELSRDDILVREVLAENYADLVERQLVLQKVVDELDLGMNWQELSERVNAQVVESTHMIEISVEAESPGRAKTIAEEVVRQMILLSPTDQQLPEALDNTPFLETQLEILQINIEEGRQKLAELEASIKPFMGVEARTKIQDEIYLVERLIADWLRSYTDLLAYAGSGEAQNYLTVIEPAQSKATPIRPNILLFTLLSAIFGYILSLGIIFLQVSLKREVDSKDELNQAMRQKVLGTIQNIDGEGYENKLLIDDDSFLSLHETFRIIRSNIDLFTSNLSSSSSITNVNEFGEFEKSADTVTIRSRAFAVTSPSAREGKSLVVANLGVMMAKAGFNTVILDANLRNPIQHELFQIDNSGGVSKFLQSTKLQAKELLLNTDITNLKLLPSGNSPELAIDLLSLARIRNLLDDLFGSADIVLIDCPAVLDFQEAVLLSNQANSVIVVVEAGETRTKNLREATSALESAGAKLMGVILNRVKKGKKDSR